MMSELILLFILFLCGLFFMGIPFLFVWLNYKIEMDKISNNRKI